MTSIEEITKALHAMSVAVTKHQLDFKNLPIEFDAFRDGIKKQLSELQDLEGEELETRKRQIEHLLVDFETFVTEKLTRLLAEFHQTTSRLLLN